MRIFAIPCVIAVLLSPRPASAQNTCHGADLHSARFVQGLNRMMTPEQTAFRAKLQMPSVTSSDIVLVSDATTCAKAGVAADSIVKVYVPTATHPPTTAPLYVIRIGTSYAVVDLNSAPNSSYDWVFIFGPLWEYRGSIGM